MKKLVVVFLVLVVVSSGVCGNAQSLFSNDRLKVLTLPTRPIIGDVDYRTVYRHLGAPESKHPGKKLVFPLQVKINCHNFGDNDRKCVEIVVALAPVAMMVSVQDIDSEEYDIDRWDAHGLIASYGGGAGAFFPMRQRHVLTMNFESGAVSVSDIPTHKKGCEAFTETDSYRLVRGGYYVDTSPNNDFDKPAKAGKK